MKISFKYGDSVICLPAKAISEHLSDATREELCVLLFIAANPSANAEDVCSELGIDSDEFMKALSFWRGSGAVSISLDEGEKLPSNRKIKKKDPAETHTSAKSEEKSEKKSRVLPSGGIPSYTTAQIADTLEKDPSLRQFVENCQQIMGKMFSSAESATLIGIVQYLDVSTDFVALLCAYAVSHGKRSVRWIEKTALNLYDDGICKYSALEAHLKIANKTEEMLPQIRKMFGMGTRALTEKEKKCIHSWCSKEIPLEIIRKAYDITVTNTNEPTVPYCNTILEKWHAAGYKTLQEVESAQKEYKRQKSAASGGSFDTDEFFEAALRRSYEITGGNIDNGE